MAPIIKHVVLADDDPDDVEVFQCALGELCPDIELTVAANGVELINLLSQVSKPDVIFLDLNMPFKTGKECLQEIRSKKEFSDVNIAVLSTSSRESDIDYCLSNGANHYFVKPTSYKGLLQIVNNLCRGEEFLVKNNR